MYDLTNRLRRRRLLVLRLVADLLGIGLPLIFLSITTASYDGIPPDKTDQASALINAARNIGGSIGVSLASTCWRIASSSTRAGWSSTCSRPAPSTRTRCSR